MSKTQEKLKTLIESEGYSSKDDWQMDNIMESAVMGICMNDGCDYTTEVEPDQRKGHCEICNTKTVESGLSLSGLA